MATMPAFVFTSNKLQHC